VSTWQKICLPIWCWKSFTHAKHEAFRFKYDTASLNKVEESMTPITIILYVNALIFYGICFICPFAFKKHCGKGIDPASHYIYGIYSLLNLVMEVVLAVRIQRLVNNESILKLNKWHWVELLMGQIARLDLYTDICFLVLLVECHEDRIAIPVASFLGVMLIYPFYMIFKLMRVNRDLNHTLPKIERNCKLGFIRENLLLAVVLDSFCITNFAQVFTTQIVFPRVMGLVTLFLQDIPQLTIHLIFLFAFHTHIPHFEFTVVFSLVATLFAIQVSLFNVIVSKPNDFDPLLLQIELKKRKEQKVNVQKPQQHSKLLENDLKEIRRSSHYLKRAHTFQRTTAL